MERENYYDLKIRHVSHWIFNCYLVEDGGEGRPFVVDAGIPLNGRAVLGELTYGAGLAASEICAICSTHTHTDHCAGAPLVHRKSGAPVCFHETLREYQKGKPGPTVPFSKLLPILPVLFEAPFDFAAVREWISAARTEGVGADPKFRLSCPVGAYLKDGDALPHAPDWKVMHTPGHSDCSISLWNEKSRTLFSGDTLLSVQGRAWFTPEHLDAAKMASTEERLRKLPVEHLFPGHGRPIHGEAILQKAWGHLERVKGPPVWTCRAKRAG